MILTGHEMGVFREEFKGICKGLFTGYFWINLRGQ